MKVKRLICFVMAFAMMLGTMSIAVAAVMAKQYSYSNCGANFITSQYVGSNNFLTNFWGIIETCNDVDYSPNPNGINVHYSAVVTGNAAPYTVIGPFYPVEDDETLLINVYPSQQVQHTIRLKIENAYYHETSTTAYKMSTNGTFTAAGPIIN